eukprot:TRINITY_DN2134_c0_g2_i1.p1 TRINITY_DN2134_c0_g2~~TRINITY_DN2134_c0_g2_i1.p1  ORF type:complete len:244 (+),score=86.58 TRINITY_DN2134_c0_g2_i1:69-734(+)
MAMLRSSPMVQQSPATSTLDKLRRKQKQEQMANISSIQQQFSPASNRGNTGTKSNAGNRLMLSKTTSDRFELGKASPRKWDVPNNPFSGEKKSASASGLGPFRGDLGGVDENILSPISHGVLHFDVHDFDDDDDDDDEDDDADNGESQTTQFDEDGFAIPPPVNSKRVSMWMNQMMDKESTMDQSTDGDGDDFDHSTHKSVSSTPVSTTSTHASDFIVGHR